jgi:hypothetical protein
MPNITRDHAELIRNKLSEKPRKPPHVPLVIETRKGRQHDIYKFKYREEFVGQFNIRRGSNRNEGHDFIPRQLHLSKREGYDFAICNISLDEYIDMLQEQQLIPQDASGGEPK